MRAKSCPYNVVLSLFLSFHILKTTYSHGFDSTLRHVKPRASPQLQGSAAMDVIRRLLPDRADEFSVTVNEAIGPKDRDTFQVIKSDGDNVVSIIGTSGVAVTSGFHYYLKYHCYCQVSWDSDQLALPDSLPTVNITITSADRFRYYQNVCTSSYSFAWWGWTRWEREIDWMALNGFNLALAFTGQEAIWQRVYRQLNLTDGEIQEHFGGPAFLAWARMGNLRGWGGPLTDNWHQQSLVLQRRILSRMRELGIAPILPAFAGHVPRAFKRLYPDAKMVPMTRWLAFSDEYCCPYLLEPTDPLFRTVGNMFASELIAEFGTDHLYNCDTFNEMTPGNGSATYLAQVGHAIFSGMADVDPKAIWVMQGWLFGHDFLFWNSKRIRAFVTSVPQGRMIVLDLQSEQNPQYERTESYYGQPFIWCMLHNFGGTLGLFGTVESVNNGMFEARKMANSTMIGSGLTPEGINQNYVIYDLMNDMAWRSEPFNLTEWFSAYPVRRYGAYDLHADNSWQLLKSSVYNLTGMQRIRGKYIICRQPSLKLRPVLWYNPIDVAVAWDDLLAAAPTLNRSLNYQHDVVDVTRQALQLLAAGYYIIFVRAFRKNQVETFQTNAALYLELLSDLDLILASNKDFLLGTWLNAAKAKGSNALERRLYEFNARNQITLWGPRGEIHDYANKQWAGDSLELAFRVHQKWRNQDEAWQAVQRYIRHSPPAKKTSTRDIYYSPTVYTLY